MRFAKKPVVIEAVQFTGSNFDEISKHVGVKQWFRKVDYAGFAGGKIVTAEVYDEIHDTWMQVRDGDWIIIGLKGEAYPCDPIVFGESYDAVSD